MGKGRGSIAEKGVQTMPSMEKYFSIRKLSAMLSADKDT